MELPPTSQNVEQRLDILAQVAHILGIDDFSFSSYAASITQLSADSLSLKRSLNRVLFAEDELQAHLASTRHEQRLLQRWRTSMEHENEAVEDTTTLERRREGLIKKAKEYHKELNVLLGEMSETPLVTVTQFVEQQETNKLKEQEVKAKRAKIKAFQGLPPNLELARHELRRARDEQMKLIQLRERLLNRMAESVA